MVLDVVACGELWMDFVSSESRVTLAEAPANVVVDGTVYVYCGGGDHVIGLATCGLDELLDYALRG